VGKIFRNNVGETVLTLTEPLHFEKLRGIKQQHSSEKKDAAGTSPSVSFPDQHWIPEKDQLAGTTGLGPNPSSGDQKWLFLFGPFILLLTVYEPDPFWCPEEVQPDSLFAIYRREMIIPIFGLYVVTA